VPLQLQWQRSFASEGWQTARMAVRSGWWKASKGT
jgi:hypothetical protein